MGKIIFKASKNLSSNKIFDEIPISNWRTVAEMDKDKLEVVIARLHRFIIYDITLEYFHLTNKNRYIIERTFEYINSPLGCSLCHGVGRIDWIQKARNTKSAPVLNIARSYFRDKDVINVLRTVEHDMINVYGSQPKIFDGQEVCGHCLGTGLESIRPINESIRGCR